jgi:hypothetical protein
MLLAVEMADVYRPSFGIVYRDCLNLVYAVDQRMMNGEFPKDEDYHKALGHIRDYGVMNGLKADSIRSAFTLAHTLSGHLPVAPSVL